MEQTVTHDVLVKFAAEKLGVSIDQQPVDGDGHKGYWVWFEVDVSGDIIDDFDLNSWDLLGKGLAVFWAHKDHHFVIECPLITLVSGERISSGNFNETGIVDIPFAFWTAWYELEHRNSVDNATGRRFRRIGEST